MKILTTYFALAYVISWVIWFPLYGHIFNLHTLHPFPFNHAIGALGPLLASIVTTFIVHKKEGLKNLLLKCIQVKPLIYLGIALIGPFVLAWVAILIDNITGKSALPFFNFVSSNEFPQFNFITFFFYNLLFFGFGEEVGWRGFALPHLQTKLNALASGVVLTVFWAVWHIPLFFYRPGFTTMGLAEIVGWVFSLLTGSILLTWLYNSSRGSILICAVFHTTIDMAFTGDGMSKDVTSYMGFLIVVWGIIMVLIYKPKTLAPIGRLGAI